MKKFILLVLVVFSSGVFAQELILNSETKIYEYEYIKESSETIEFLTSSFESKLNDLNYKDVIFSTDKITSQSFFTKLIMGTPMEIRYNLTIDFKEGKYKVLFNKFIIEDKRFGSVPLEDIKSAKKKWIKTINEKLPDLIAALESKAKDW
ncbi:hypothetical protein LXD69_07335 [Flavobacterium sediminilitoris]|uniref:DUF4468 domain-containing protein n=1 Tax=Flavobacterium sediminilitoris TaxID=2024526 RepID=A0ABY4HR20_9FLAO|nr:MULTISPECIES: hypothetical protein [Flavobacterium]UOX35324.1 hypothetical protein LXD69_07335 [Flavobacterium sediminilitoris]